MSMTVCCTDTIWRSVYLCERDDMADMETEQPAERSSGLQAIWANTLEPVAPLPWYRRVPRTAWIAGAVVVALFTALTWVVMTGAGALPKHRIVLADRIGDQQRMPDDEAVKVMRGDLEKNLTSANPVREVTAASYGTIGSSKSTLLVAGKTGTFSDARGQLDEYFAGMSGTIDVPGGATVADRQDYPAGPLGGALDCAVLPYPDAPQTTCAWADGTTVGIVIDETGASRPEDLAKRTMEIRAAVEVKAGD
ncbi:hypothetical protein ACIG5E_21435 [Kitasatospora sp. NPDC053057]|uniref:hypothetical protein n=1 Tax=Kitasatospora sp. NPDC053057 TaxID=3364062 RepID=UPI0037C5AF9C